jgi:hypothetical protein
MFERDGQRYLKRLADLDVEHWNALCIDLWAYIDAGSAPRRQDFCVNPNKFRPQALPVVARNLCA